MRLLKCARCGEMKDRGCFPEHRSRTCSACRAKPHLNQAQEIALVLLAERGPMRTTNRNGPNSIATATVEALERLGLAIVRGKIGPSGAYYEAALTDEGRALVG